MFKNWKHCDNVAGRVLQHVVLAFFLSVANYFGMEDVGLLQFSHGLGFAASTEEALEDCL